MRHTIGIALLLTMTGYATRGAAFDPDDLPAVQTAAHGVCNQPEQQDTYLHHEGDLSAGATLTIQGVAGTGTITQQAWSSIAQIADHYKIDNRACIASITAIVTAALDTPRGCSARGIDHYAREYDLTQASTEMGGGHTPQQWCDTLQATMHGLQPGAEVTVINKDSQTNNHCPPLRCLEYVYTCTLHVKADAVCR